MREVIVDCDPGVDDALSLIYLAMSKAVKILAVTTVAGNHEVEYTTNNALRVLEALGLDDVPVYKGSPAPLTRELYTVTHIHGNDGLGDSDLPMPSKKPEGEEAHRFLASFIWENVDRVDILATGPLTNLARALSLRPGIAEKIDRFVIMGGNYFLTPFGYGNVTRVSEFNFFVDPEAAHMVLHSGVKVGAVGLDVTQDPGTALTGRMVRLLGDLPKRILRNPISKLNIFHLHDPMAAVFYVKPSLFRSTPLSVSVGMYDGDERGVCLVDKRGIAKPNIDVVYRVDRRAFLLEVIEKLSKA